MNTLCTSKGEAIAQIDGDEQSVLACLTVSQLHGFRTNGSTSMRARTWAGIKQGGSMIG